MEVAATNTAVATPVQDLDGCVPSFATTATGGGSSHDNEDGRFMFASTRNEDIPYAAAELVAEQVVRNDDEEQYSSADPSQRSEYTTISVCKPSIRSSLGITFTDVAPENGAVVVVVEYISPESPFRTTPLRCGDALVSINQYEATSAQLVERIVKTTEQWLTLVIHTTQGVSDQVTTVLNKRVPNQRLGINFSADPCRGALYVSSLTSNGLLVHISLVQVGDLLHTINGQSAHSVDVAMELLSSNPDQVELITTSTRGTVLVFQTSPVSRYFWWKCVAVVLLLIGVMFVAYYFAVSKPR
jgi:hypothetical protein